MTAVDLSRDRRRRAVRMVRSDCFLSAPLDEAAQIVYVVGILAADSGGVVAEAALTAAMSDPSVVGAARQILAKARGPRSGS